MNEASAPARGVDWRVPLQAHAEETYWTDVAEDGSGQPRRAIRWHLSAEGLARVKRMEACWDCLAGFPAPPRRDTWHTWATSGFKFIHSMPYSRDLIRMRRCPLCKAEITPEMLAIQIDEAWTAEDAKLKSAKLENLDDDRERFDHIDVARATRLGLIDPKAPPSKRKSAKRRGEQ